MSTLRSVVEALAQAAADGEPVVLASVVRVVGSSYGGVGARMLVHADGRIVGLVSGGCLESDLAEHARQVHATGRARLVTYDTRADDDALWGLGLGCNGLVEVLLEPLPPARAGATGRLLADALAGDGPAVLATVVEGTRAADGSGGAPAVGAHALLAADGRVHPLGDWGDGEALTTLAGSAALRRDALAAGRRGLVCALAGVQVACEVIAPAVRLVVCGSGPDVAPVVALASRLGWDVTVVDHRPAAAARPERLPGARVVACDAARRLADALPLGPHTAAVVMSHHFARDTDYVAALLEAGAGYVGVLGPRARTGRMLAELAARGQHVPAHAPGIGGPLHAPVGLDVGGDGPEAIALAVVAEVSAVVHGRAGGSLRDRAAALHDAPVRLAPGPGQPS